jgi:hypothetical protein
MTQQPAQRAATSLRLEGPALGLGLDPDEIDAYPLIVQGRWSRAGQFS